MSWNYSLNDDEIVKLTFRKYGVRITTEQIAKAYWPEQRMSWKKSVEVAKFIKGMTLRQAQKWLEGVTKLEKPIPVKTFKKKQAHHATPWRGWPVAKWPVKVAKRYLQLLENLENNARFRGLDVERLVIVHTAAHKGVKIWNYMPRAFGRATPFVEETVNIEAIAVELPNEVLPKSYRLNLVKR